MSTEFTKMHGLGNDFIVLQGPQKLSQDQIAAYCDRHTGVGADGLLVVSPLGDNRIEMKYWNADGSVAEMCGNGLRCTTKFAVDNRLAKPGDFTVETGAGSLKVSWDGQDPNRITTQVGKVRVDDAPLTLEGLVFHTANAGNPHAITFVKEAGSELAESVGSVIETDPHFPNKTNVEFVQILSPNSIRMDVWERGVGITLACATGMVACAAAAVKLHGITLPMQIEVPGGSAEIWRDKDDYYCLRGPAVSVFQGTLPEQTA